MPCLSVVIPAYNSQQTLEKCLKAIRESTFKDYELIVVDGKSTDSTRLVAKEYADRVIAVGANFGRSHNRNQGVAAASGRIVVNIDADIVVEPDTLQKIANYFSAYPQISALNGILAREHPHLDFFSQYKNLYMHYRFYRLPERVNFLYGSLHALRREDVQPYNARIKIADDTALGQSLVAGGKEIALVKGLEVIHLKKYNFFSLVQNDFQIPFDWAKIFLSFKGFKQLGRNKTGFAHASKAQLISVSLAPLITGLLVLALAGSFHFYFGSSFLLIWFLLNYPFFRFLGREKGLAFAAFAVLVTFLDNLIMALGIICGALAFLMGK